MRLRKIELRNFRPYYGEVTLDFPAEPTTDFYLIHGQNGFGKTSLLHAVQWGLFGESSVREVFDHFNTAARAEQGSTLGIELTFEHEDDEFRVLREARSTGDSVAAPQDMRRSELTVYRNGTPITPSEVAQDRIHSIIPKDASQFFLFDAEQNNRYSASSLTDDTRQAIELVLGMRPVQNARDDAANVRGDIRRRRNQEMRRSETQVTLVEELELLQGEVETLRKSESDLVNKIRDAQTKLDDYREELDRLQEVQVLAGQRDQLAQRIDAVRRDRTVAIEELQKEAQGLYLRVVAQQVKSAYDETSALYEAMREQEMSRRLAESIRLYLNELASRDTCVCGRALDADHRAHIQEAVADATPAPDVDEDDPSESSTELAARLEALRQAKTKTEIAAQRYAELQVRKIDLDEELSDLDTQLVRAESQINSLDVDSVNSLRELIRRLEEDLALMQREQGGLQHQCEDKERQLEAKDREVTRLTSANSAVAALDAQMNLLERSENAFDALLTRSASARRGQIAERANQFFGKITNKEFGYKEMFIRDDFTFGIRTHTDAEPSMDNISEGEKQVVAFCFVMGLNRHSKASAPLMIDTPMARLDIVHRQNIARALSELGQQAVLFVTDADLGFGVGEIFDEFVDRQFEIAYDQESLASTIRVKEDAR
jgi:DNA sulfur modification protein DndD